MIERGSLEGIREELDRKDVKESVSCCYEGDRAGLTSHFRVIKAGIPTS
jgi:hypothetical protein